MYPEKSYRTEQILPGLTDTRYEGLGNQSNLQYFSEHYQGESHTVPWGGDMIPEGENCDRVKTV